MFIAKLPWQKNCAQIDNQYKTDLAIFSLTLGVVVKTIVTVLIVEIYVSSYSLSCVSMILDEFEKCFHFICSLFLNLWISFDYAFFGISIFSSYNKKPIVNCEKFPHPVFCLLLFMCLVI